MRFAVLFSGGKDSCLAVHRARVSREMACLISLVSENPESYMFHVPNIRITELQAEAAGLPIIQRKTKGEKEKELEDLKEALILAKAKFRIEGVVTGAIRSKYQVSRVREICGELGLQCLNPLWQNDENELLNEVVSKGFKAIVSGVFAYPLDRRFLGREIDDRMIQELMNLKDKYNINPAGEGGEIETTVLDAPFFKRRIKIADYEIIYSNNTGIYLIKEAYLVDKQRMH